MGIAYLMGSIWTFKAVLQVCLYSGQYARVRSEPPNTELYVRWCGTRGWLSVSAKRTRFALVLAMVVLITIDPE